MDADPKMSQKSAENLKKLLLIFRDSLVKKGVEKKRKLPVLNCDLLPEKY